MRSKLGISVYPDKADLKKIEDYIKLASSYDFGLVFINFIEVLESNSEKVINNFINTIKICKKNNMKVTLDVNKSTFDHLNIDYKNPDLKYFSLLGIDVLRLDETFDGLFESTLTFNPYNIKIELNPSTMSMAIQNILSYKANVQNLQALHNFYPQNLTGLSYEKFKNTNKLLKQHGIKFGAFVTINDHSSMGPWEVNENLPTLEMHRNLPIGMQINHLISSNQAQYIYISSQFATNENFKEIIKFFKYKKILKCDFEKNISNIELDIIKYSNHLIRGDVNEYFFRSTETRKIFKTQQIRPKSFNDKVIKRGSLVIPNSDYAKYKGELQIVIKDILNDGKRNLVGKISKEWMFMLDELDSWDRFEVI